MATKFKFNIGDTVKIAKKGRSPASKTQLGSTFVIKRQLDLDPPAYDGEGSYGGAYEDELELVSSSVPPQPPPSKFKFNIGDMVKIVKKLRSANASTGLGETFVITRQVDAMPPAYCGTGYGGGVYEDELELVAARTKEEETAPMTTKTAKKPFKIGSRVKVVADTCSHRLPVGSIVTIQKEEGEGKGLHYYLKEKPVVVKPEDIEEVREFKIGDQVKIIGNTSYHDLSIGSTWTIRSKRNGVGRTIYLFEDTDWEAYPEDLELVTEAEEKPMTTTTPKPPAKFKKDDLVRILNRNSSGHSLNNGDILKILSVLDRDPPINYGYRFYSSNQIAHESELELANAHKFKVGDKVKVVSDTTGAGHKVGAEYIVEELRSSNENPPRLWYAVQNGRGIYEKDLELVTVPVPSVEFKFKIGDKVVNVNGGGITTGPSLPTLYNLLTIKSHRLCEITKKPWYFFEEKAFEGQGEAEINLALPPKFKVGDRIEIIGNAPSGHRYNTNDGDKFTIKKIEWCRSHPGHCYTFENGGCTYEEYLKPIQKFDKGQWVKVISDTSTLKHEVVGKTFQVTGITTHQCCGDPKGTFKYENPVSDYYIVERDLELATEEPKQKFARGQKVKVIADSGTVKHGATGKVFTVGETRTGDCQGDPNGFKYISGLSSYVILERDLELFVEPAPVVEQPTAQFKVGDRVEVTEIVKDKHYNMKLGQQFTIKYVTWCDVTSKWYYSFDDGGVYEGYLKLVSEETTTMAATMTREEMVKQQVELSKTHDALREKINFLDRTGLKVFDEKVFKVWNTIKDVVGSAVLTGPQCQKLVELLLPAETPTKPTGA